jgi:hypothetical protein
MAKRKADEAPPEQDVQALLEEGDQLLVSAFAHRDRVAQERLYLITVRLCNDHHYAAAELGRRWGRDRRTISVWKRKGAELCR